MGKYDIDAKYSEDCDLTIGELCHEIKEEYYAYYVHNEKAPREEKLFPSWETFYNKFKNSDQSGLVDKLVNNLNFDMESIAENNPLELFDMLKILKLLYYIEKIGDPKCKKIDYKYKESYSDDVRIQITDILKKPRLENIQSEFSNNSVYGKIFADMFDKIKNVVDDAEERCLRLEKINLYWEYITDSIFDYVITDKALAEPEDANNELERINRFLKEKVLARLQGIDVTGISNSEGVMKTFFNILACHRLLCNEVDRININYHVSFSEPPSQEYVNNLKKYEFCEVKWDLLPIIIKRLSGENDNIEAGNLLYFISYGLEIPNTDIKHYKYAVKHAKIVASWIEKYKEADFSNGIPVDMLSAIMQEIISNKKNSDKVLNDYYGYNNKWKSILTALKKTNMADAVVMQAWIKKLENRVAVNYGAYALIQRKRDIEITIYEIKKILYSYRNLNDLEFVNDVLSHFVARSVTSRNLAMAIGVRFAKKIAANFCGAAKQIQNFQMWPEGINVLDMFREFLVDKHNIEDAVAKDVARQVNAFYKEESTVTGRSMCCDFEIYYSEKYHHDFRFVFFVDKSSNYFEYRQFFEICSDDDVCEMKHLGLEKFIKR